MKQDNWTGLWNNCVSERHVNKISEIWVFSHTDIICQSGLLNLNVGSHIRATASEDTSGSRVWWWAFAYRQRQKAAPSPWGRPQIWQRWLWSENKFLLVYLPNQDTTAQQKITWATQLELHTVCVLKQSNSLDSESSLPCSRHSNINITVNLLQLKEFIIVQTFAFSYFEMIKLYFINIIIYARSFCPTLLASFTTSVTFVALNVH